MKSCKLIIIAVSLIQTISFSQIPPLKWAKKMGGGGSAYSYSVTTDIQGNVFTTGYFRDTIDFDPGSSVYNLISAGGYDIFVSKFDSSGNFLWAKKMGGINTSAQGYDIAVDKQGNVYTTGFFNGTVDFDPGTGSYNLSATNTNSFILKLDQSGNFLWAKKFDGFNFNAGYALALDNFGNVYTTGFFFGAVDFDPGTGTYNLPTPASLNVFISKLDSLGNFVWAQQIGNNSSGKSYGICVDIFNNVYITGVLNEEGYPLDPLWSSLDHSGLDFNDTLFVTKLDNTGNIKWTKYMQCDSSAEAKDIAVDKSGNVYSTGRFLGTMDFDPGPASYNLTAIGNEDLYVSKLDSLGNFIWVKRFNGPSNGNIWNRSNGLALDKQGNIYITGNFSNTMDLGLGINMLTSAGNFDLFIIKLNPSGNYAWASAIGSPSLEYGVDISTDIKNNIYVTGVFNGLADFDPGNAVYNMTPFSGFGTVFVLKIGGTIGNTIIPVVIDSTCRLDISTKIYPNPSSYSIIINKNPTVCKVSMNVYNMIGQLIIKNKIINDGINEMSLLNISAGIYYYEFISNEKILLTGRFIKQ